MIVSQAFANAPSSVRLARRFAGEQLANLDPQIADAIKLMVSELATNSVRHAGTGFTVSVERRAGSVRVEVADNGTGTPALRTPSPAEPTGRGLRIVAELSNEWGISSSPRAGSMVWFSVRCDGAEELVP